MPDIDISLIWVKRDSRQRRKLEPDLGLQSSIERVGLINPIIVTKEYQLVAGERRYEACKAIHKKQIAVRWAEELSADELRVIELEENIKRKDLSWQDTARAISDLHSYYAKINQDWNQAKTAQALSMDRGHISNTLLVASHLKDQKVAKATTMQEARNFIRRRNERADEAEINDLAIMARQMFSTPTPVSSISGVQPPPKSDEIKPAPWTRAAVDTNIIQADFTEWIKTYDGNTFNFIHCDFPYGANVFGGNSQFKPDEEYEAYEDKANIYWDLLNCLISNMNKLMSPAAHLMLWLTARPEVLNKTVNILEQFMDVYPFPLMWHKSDNSGIVGDSQRWPRHVYETALLAYTGKRPLIKTVGDSYSGPGDRRLHPSCKPEAMLRHFFGAIVDEHTRFFDPTCGAGSSLRAAESLGALPANCLGLEIEERFVSVAKEALISSRILGEASKRA